MAFLTKDVATEQDAINEVQKLCEDGFVHCFGKSGDHFDVAVYASQKDFNLDAEEGDNKRMIDRIFVRQIR